MKLRKYKILPSLFHRPDDYPYPIHDWKDESLYAKNRTAKEWAWEFFRRNKEYQYDNDRFKNKAHFPEFNIIYPEKVNLSSQKNLVQDARQLGFIYDEILFLENNINESYAYRQVKQENDIIIPIKDAIWKKYGIFPQSNTLLHDPRLDLDKHNFFYKKSSHITHIPYVRSLTIEEQHSLEPLIPENIVFRLSADKSIKRQLELVERELHKRRELLEIPSPKKSPRKVRNSQYIKYIRMLDAFAFYGLSESSTVRNEIAIEIVHAIEELNPNTKSTHQSTLRSWKRSAFPLVELGYLELLEK